MSDLTGLPSDIEKYSTTGSFGLECMVGYKAFFSDLTLNISGLSSDDWRERCVAMEILIRHWQFDTARLATLLETSLVDSHIEVRTFGAVLLGQLLKGTMHKKASSALAKIVMNHACQVRERRIAYESLLDIQMTAEERLAASSRARGANDILEDRMPQLDYELLARVALD